MSPNASRGTSSGKLRLPAAAGYEAPAITVRAAAVLFRGEALLVQRRRGDSVWALPGGRVKPGEPAAAAVVRELTEELAEHVEVQRLIFLAEHVFAHRGRTQHELGVYFLASLQQRSQLLSRSGPFAGVEKEADLEFCWFSRHELVGIDLRPSFLASALAASPLELRHVVVARSETEV